MKWKRARWNSPKSYYLQGREHYAVIENINEKWFYGIFDGKFKKRVHLFSSVLSAPNQAYARARSESKLAVLDR